MAIATGRASVVVCWRARNRSKAAGGRPWEATGMKMGGDHQWSAPFGLVRPVDQIAMVARRHMHEHGTTERQLGAVAVECRKHAGHNPHGLEREPRTHAEHGSAGMTDEPVRRIDG